MQINASLKIKTLKGEPFKTVDGDMTLGTVLAEVFANDKTGGQMKVYALAQKFNKGGKVEVDTADLAMIKKSVEASQVQWNNIIMGQALEMLEQVK